ncbi:MAG: RNA pseudouridine synthase [Treponema sp.]|nr:MAG: RNA pseudouridine synthase [Treponema sp.]
MQKLKHIKIVYKDEDIIVVDKPAGISVLKERWDNTAENLNDLLSIKLLQQGISTKLYSVHRLDKDTSGVMIFALNVDAHKIMNSAFKNRQIKKTYHAFVYGKPTECQFKIEKKLLPDSDRRHRTSVNEKSGKSALTLIKTLETFKHISLLEARPITGRTHQIRAHLAGINLPIVCDSLYGNSEPVFLSKLKTKWRGSIVDERPIISRTSLHSQTIEFEHPRTKEPLVFKAMYPKDLKALLNQLRKLSR